MYVSICQEYQCRHSSPPDKETGTATKTVVGKENFLTNTTLRSEDHRTIFRRFCPKGGWFPWGFCDEIPQTTPDREGATHGTNGAAPWVTQL